MKKIAFFLLLIVIWAAISESGIVESYLFPGPKAVGEAFWSETVNGQLPLAVLSSFRRLAIGYGLALIVGVSLGFLLSWNKLAEELFGSLIAGMQSIPSIAWLPLAVLWLGLSEAAIIAIVFLGAVWSITLNTEAGVKNVPPLMVRAGRNMGAKGLTLFTQVIFPAALPQMISGWRLAWAFAWRSLMAGELLSPGRGLGERLLVYRNINDMASVLAVIILIGVVGSSVDNLVFQQMERTTRRRWGTERR